MNYVKPELIVLAFVLYFIGMGLKKSETIKDKYIPIILGVTGVLLSALWVLGNFNANATGDCDGIIYSNCAGNFGRWSEYIYKSND